MLTKFAIFEQPAEFVLVGSLNLLHACRNALRNKKACTYAVCWMFHAKMDKRKERQERTRERVRDMDREKEMRDHHNLVVITDENYLNKKYLCGCLDSGYKVPVQCSPCYCYITNNSKKLKKVN